MPSRLRHWPLALGIFLLGCDPGFDYRPEGWDKVDRNRWRARIDDIELQTGLLGDLIASRGVVPEFEVTNLGTENLVLAEARLIGEGGNYPAKLPGQGELRWRSAAPGSSKRISLLWEFDDPALHLLGERPRIVLEFRSGEERRLIEIEYERVK